MALYCLSGNRRLAHVSHSPADGVGTATRKLRKVHRTREQFQCVRGARVTVNYPETQVVGSWVDDSPTRTRAFLIQSEWQQGEAHTPRTLRIRRNRRSSADLGMNDCIGNLPANIMARTAELFLSPVERSSGANQSLLWSANLFDGCVGTPIERFDRSCDNTIDRDSK